MEGGEGPKPQVQQLKDVQQPWEAGPLDPTWLESKIFPPHANFRPRAEVERGYVHFRFQTISEVSKEEWKTWGFQDEVESSARHGNAELVRIHMEDPAKKNLFSQEFKIHLQPQRKFVPLIAAKLGEFFQDEEVRKFVSGFKVELMPDGKDERGEDFPEIVIYPNFGRENARLVLTRLRQQFAGFERYGTGVAPRYNAKLSELLFLAQSSGDLKNALADVGLLDEYFDEDTNYAFMKGEKSYWQDLVPEKPVQVVQVGEAVKRQSGLPERSPQEDLEWVQEFLKVAQAQKLNQNMRWDERRRQISQAIQARLGRNETLDEIIAKSAANLRAIRSRMRSS